MKNRLFLAAVGAFAIACVAASLPAAGAEEAAAHPSIAERVAGTLRRAGLSDELVVLVIAALPIVELRGAVPVGHMLGMNPWKVYALAVIGNMVPVPLILLFLKPVAGVLTRFRLGARFLEWLFARTRRKSATIEKYETLGLAIFVAIPLPATGGWTGALAAFLMGIKFHHAMLSILLGVMIAGVIMTVLSLMGWLGALIAGVVLLAMALGALREWLRREKPAARPAA